MTNLWETEWETKIYNNVLHSLLKMAGKWMVKASMLCGAKHVAWMEEAMPLTFVSGIASSIPPMQLYSAAEIPTLGMIWGSHGGEYEDGCLLGCSTA
jgi:hypothetical protein